MDDGIEETENKLQQDLFWLCLWVYDYFREFSEVCFASSGEHNFKDHYGKPNAV